MDKFFVFVLIFSFFEFKSQLLAFFVLKMFLKFQIRFHEPKKILALEFTVNQKDFQYQKLHEMSKNNSIQILKRKEAKEKGTQ